MAGLFGPTNPFGQGYLGQANQQGYQDRLNYLAQKHAEQQGLTPKEHAQDYPQPKQNKKVLLLLPKKGK